MVTLGALLLADSRLPTGGHVHSGGVEAAVQRGLLRDETDLELFLAGRLRGSGVVVAALAAAGCLLASAPEQVDWGCWDAAVSARTPCAAAREISRAQGMTLLRTARRVWPSRALDALHALGRAHHPLVLGAAVAAAGDDPATAAALALHQLLGAACSAAVRLLGLDPIEVAVVQTRMTRSAEQMARDGAVLADTAVVAADTRLLPSTGTPLPEVLAELHARTEVTLFAS